MLMAENIMNYYPLLPSVSFCAESQIYEPCGGDDVYHHPRCFAVQVNGDDGVEKYGKQCGGNVLRGKAFVPFFYYQYGGRYEYHNAHKGVIAYRQWETGYD